jgi:hypothetical protein
MTASYRPCRSLDPLCGRGVRGACLRWWSRWWCGCSSAGADCLEAARISHCARAQQLTCARLVRGGRGGVEPAMPMRHGSGGGVRAFGRDDSLFGRGRDPSPDLRARWRLVPAPCGLRWGWRLARRWAVGACARRHRPGGPPPRAGGLGFTLTFGRFSLHVSEKTVISYYTTRGSRYTHTALWSGLGSSCARY